MGDEYGKFEVSERDFEDALNPGMRRHRMTKEQATYGVWAVEEDGDSTRNQGSAGKLINFQRMKKKGEKIRRSEKSVATDNTQDFGVWERYTTGFGSKILHKMGFRQGRGLGKDGSGIIEPVQAVARQGRASLGAYGSEKVGAPRRGKDPTAESEEEEQDSSLVGTEPSSVSSQPKRLWKKSRQEPGGGGIGYTFKTMDQLRDETLGDVYTSSQVDRIKVVDMMGPEAKVSFGYDSMTRQKHLAPKLDTKHERYFDLPELRHNISLLVAFSEKSIKSDIKKIRIRKDVLTSLTHEEECLLKTLQAQTDDMNELIEFLNLLEEIRGQVESENNMVELMNYFIIEYGLLHQKFARQCQMFNIKGLCGSIIFPTLAKLLKRWDPFADPQCYLSLFRDWKEVVIKSSEAYSIDESFFSFTSSEDLFERTICDVWAPRFAEVLSAWNMRDYEPVITFLCSWKPLLNDSLWDFITNHVTLQCLQVQVEQWDPVTDRQPAAHAWIECWVDIIGSKELESVHSIVTRKLGEALSEWHPSDPSAKLVLTPWFKLLSPSHQQSLIVRNIAPKLTDCLVHDLVINPRQQALEPFLWVMEWKEMVDPNLMAAVFARGFFTKWLHVLHLWLSENPNYDDVRKWYSGWKSLFEPRLQAQQQVKGGFNQALLMIQQSINGAPLSSSTDYQDNAALLLQQHEQSQAAAASFSHKVTLTFREMVEQSATENGLPFNPLPRRHLDGKVVYQFGISHIYIDRGVIFVQSDSSTHSWIPISLAELVKISK